MSGGEMPQSEQQSPRPTGALLVHGSDVPKLTFDILSVHLELLLSELDRAMSGGKAAQFDWQTLDRSYRGHRVLVTPEPLPRGLAARPASRVLERARRGIAVLTGGPRRPPMFTDVALEQLAWIVQVVEDTNVSRLYFYAGGMQEETTGLTLSNLRELLSS